MTKYDKITNVNFDDTSINGRYKDNIEPYDLESGDIRENWFKALPFAFKAFVDGSMKIFYLPISPQNITTTTHFANNIVATLMSTVEEHSQQRYFDIVIQGTTGFAPTYTKAKDVKEVDKDIIRNPSGKRARYEDSSEIEISLGGFASKTIGIINQIKSTASDLLNGRHHEVGVFNDNNGYIAFHNFYRFLLKYKRDIQEGKKQNENNKNYTPLTFINYKDNIQYSCVIQRFVLERSADNPMLYNYSIQIRAYDLKTITDSKLTSQLPSEFLREMGLSENQTSLASKIKNGVRKVKSVVNGALNGIGTLGR